MGTRYCYLVDLVGFLSSRLVLEATILHTFCTRITFSERPEGFDPLQNVPETHEPLLVHTAPLGSTRKLPQGPHLWRTALLFGAEHRPRGLHETCGAAISLCKNKILVA